jgi:hypothetical protein
MRVKLAALVPLLRLRLSTLMLFTVIIALISALIVHHEEMSHQIANCEARLAFEVKSVQSALKTQEELRELQLEKKRLEAQNHELRFKLMQRERQ